MQKNQNYINGKLVPPANNNYRDNYEPATEKVYSLAPESNFQDLENAVVAAENAQQNWANMPSGSRSRLMMKLADAIELAFDELAKAEAIDNGKPIAFAKAVNRYRSAANIRFFANAGSEVQRYEKLL